MEFHTKVSPLVWGVLGEADWNDEDCCKEGAW